MRHRYAMQAKRNASTERWLVSYADYMTLMFALFVVLYAMAIANEQEYPELQLRLQQAIALFEADKPINQSTVTIESKGLADEGILFTGQSILDGEVFKREVPRTSDVESYSDAGNEGFIELAEQLATEFKDFLKNDDIVISYDEQWLTIELDSRLFFASGSAYLLTPAAELIDVLAEKLVQLDNYIRVRGYTDEDSIDSELYPSNWELSAARATRILRELQARGVAPARMALEAYAEFAPDENAASHRKNRRVVIALAKTLWQPKVKERAKEPLKAEAESTKQPDSETMLAVPLEGGGVRFTTRQEE
ncbi:flagellar motor protein MotB [Agarivorans litoreus]|uniref:flagellar motor protein MotB n=1 Tax=Agarivorans litoreus TaxID=1510455 RepID=UPI001C7D94DF|nr:flagellar motor protein MotB [Agarivorans litoreus]